jgi:hypothetical protein
VSLWPVTHSECTRRKLVVSIALVLPVEMPLRGAGQHQQYKRRALTSSTATIKSARLS